MDFFCIHFVLFLHSREVQAHIVKNCRCRLRFSDVWSTGVTLLFVSLATVHLENLCELQQLIYLTYGLLIKCTLLHLFRLTLHNMSKLTPLDSYRAGDTSTTLTNVDK